MCGIAGIAWKRGAPADARAIVERMTEAIAHRGPDGAAIVETPFATVGFRRLAILDLVTGDQPMWSEDGRVGALLNGEIFNHHELRAGLLERGHALGTRADTEVLPHLYEELGTGIFARLNGMYGICIIDRARRCVVIARDQIGVKQLYIAETPEALVFSSEMKGVLASGLLEARADLRGVVGFLSLFYCPGPGTLVEGVEKLGAGCWAELGPDGRRDGRFYEVRARAERIGHAEAVARTRELLCAAVDRQLEADVPIGVCVSGGVDSSAIAWAAAQRGADRLRAITIRWSESGEEDAAHARELCQGLGLRHEVIETSGVSPMEDLALLGWMTDEPVADPSLYSQWCISRAASEHVKVLLSGAGGDELFGGYMSYDPPPGWRAMLRLPGWMQRVAHAAGTSRKIDREWLEAMVAYRRSRAAWHAGCMSSLTRDERAELSGVIPGSAAPMAGIDAVFERYSRADGLTQQMLVDLLTYLPEQVLPMLDRATMAASIEGRVPLLDVELVDFAFSIDGEAKVGRPFMGKRLLKEAIAPGVPASVVRRVKSGLPSPFESAIAAEHGGVVRSILLREGGFVRSLVPPGWIERRLADGLAARRAWRVLYAMVVLEVWHRLYIEERSYARPTMSLDDLFEPTRVGAA